MRTIIYIDGFNLYYGCLKGTSYKWLDLKKLFSYILGHQNQIIAINYFTAIAKPIPTDLYVAKRQNSYLNALKVYIPEINIHLGHFLKHEVYMPLVNSKASGPKTALVYKTEEKGSDVNLAVHLLNDAWLNKFDCAVIVSNDSDLAESICLVKKHHPQKICGVITPGQERRTSEQLKKYANFVRKIRQGALAASQLPNPIPGTNIRKPDSW